MKQNKHHHRLHQLSNIMVGLVLVLGFCPTLMGQALSAHVVHYTLSDGIPQSMVNAIFQDRDGIIWIGTGNGIAFFNGSEFVAVNPYDPDSSGVGNLLVEQGYTTSTGNFWLHYENYGWKYFNPAKRSFIHRPINRFSEQAGEGPFVYAFDDPEGRTWTKTLAGKVYLINKDRNKAVNLNEAGLIQTDYVYGVTSQPNTKQLFLISNKGIHVFDEKSQSFRLIPYSIPVGFFYYRSNYPMLWLDDDQLLIGLPGKILHFDAGTESFLETTIPLLNGHQNFNSIRLMVSDRNGGFYYEVDKIIYHQRRDGQTDMIWRSTANPELEVDVRCMLLDNNGLLWIGTNANGIYKIHPEAFPVNTHSYKHNFHADVLSEIPGFNDVKLPGFWKSSKWSYDFRWVYDGSGNIYTAFSKEEENGSRLLKYDQKKWKILPGLDSLTEMIAGLVISGDTVYAMHREGGLYAWTNPDFMPAYIHLSPDKVLNEVVGIHRYKNYWLTLEMRSGIRIFKDNKPHKVYSISGLDNVLPVKVNRFTCILPKSEEPARVLLGTYGNGIIEWDVEKGFVGMALPGEQLNGAVLFAMAKDDLDRIWLTTSNGIKLFDPGTKKLIDLDGLQGMPSFEFNRFHIFKYPDGRMAFGGMEGWVDLPASAFKPGGKAIDIAFTGCFINGEARRQTSVTNNFIQLNTDSTLVFDHTQNYFRFEFTGTNYTDEKLEYRYMLEGYDKQWNESGSVGAANYSNLPPDKYRLLVQCRTSGSEWIQRPTGILNFNISPPWWASWYAYVVYTLIFVTGVILLWRNRQNKMRLQFELAEETMKAQQLQELDGLKTKFIDNITHELRTPLTLIHTPLSTIASDPSLSGNSKKHVALVKRHSTRLIELVNQMLDLSKIQVGAMQEQKSIGDLKAFLEDIVGSFEEQAKQEGKILESNINPGHSMMLFDKEKWSRIVQNLLSNALKHTAKDDIIRITLLSEGDERLRLTVSDSGEGIQKDQVPFIFQRFYQADNALHKEGTGIGLSLVKELVDLMHGSINVESVYGQGSRFMVKLPMHLHAAEGEVMDTLTKDELITPAFQNINHEEKEKPLILLVEDNEELNSFIRSELEKDFRVLYAFGGEEGLNLARLEVPDLIITDWMMPGMDGLGLCAAIKEDGLTRHIPVLILTAKASVESRLQGLASGADDYLPKPFVWDEVLLKIQNQLRQKENLKVHLQKDLIPATPPEEVPDASDPFLKEVYGILSEKYKEALDVNTLAELMHLHRRTLHRKIMALLGIGPNELIKQFRLQKASSMLISGASASEAGYACGFDSPSYFSKCFKEQYGLSPTEFQNK
ncbi:MAG: response regulator [Saprospiraceae bacterium]|nr:response regulator [Saprospiraceae bacterium]